MMKCMTCGMTMNNAEDMAHHDMMMKAAMMHMSKSMEMGMTMPKADAKMM